jgi:L-cystine uptake protein TcyP (sodium:dicarboxylate symporter family)
VKLAVNPIDFTKTMAYVIVGAFLWRSAAAALSRSDNPTATAVSGAMAFIL